MTGPGAPDWWRWQEAWGLSFRRPFLSYCIPWPPGVSTGKLFLAGILPGFLVGLALMVYAVIYCLHRGEDKAKVQERMAELSRRGFWKLLKESLWALLCPVIVLGGIYTGFTTPTEAAAVSVFYALLVSLFLYHTMTVRDILPFCGNPSTPMGAWPLYWPLPRPLDGCCP